MLKLYNELAAWWPVFSPPADYVEEVRFFQQVLLNASLPAAPTFLELGSGGGNNASLLKALFAHMTLTDISPGMLAVSRKLNPECEHIEGDMRSLRLDRLFDVVFIHDAIDYMITLQDLEQAIETAFIHCKQGGLAMFVPDHVRETFQPLTDHGGEDGEGRAIRWLEWSYDPDENDATYTTEYAILLKEGDEPSQIAHDRHLCGLFRRAEWLRLLQEAGFKVELIRDEFQRDVFVAHRPKG
jgi:SAM-dependent methyltransferase